MNETQLEQITQCYGADILRFCCITAGSREAGYDLYQDTMLTVLEKRALLDAAQNPKSYILSIALNLWRNHQRKQQRHLARVPQESLDALSEQGILPAGDSGDPEEQLLRKARIAQVRRLVAALPEKYRLPIQLFYAADASLSEIARTLHLPENTVKTRLHRGKKIIRQQLEEEFDDERSGI